MDLPFSEEEIWNVIKQSPADRTPGPDGFTGTFFRAYWGIIKADLVNVVKQFFELRSDGL